MTFRPEQIMTNEEWDRRHEGHTLVRREERFPLGGSAVKRLMFKKCKDCDEEHLYKMTTTFDCPHCGANMEEDGPHCKKCAKRPTCDRCKKRKNRVISVPGTRLGVCGPCFRRYYE